MKILQLANRIPWPLKDGGAIGIYHLACGYAEEGHEVTLFCLNTVKHHIQLDSLPAPFHTQFRIVDSPIDNRVRVIPAILNLFGSESYNISRFKSDQVNADLARVASEFQPELVHFDGPFMLPYWPIIRKSAPQAKCIMRAHNVEFRIWERMAKHTNNRWKARYFRLLARRLKDYEINSLNKLDGFLPISETDLATFRQEGVRIPALVSPAGLPLTVEKKALPKPMSKSFCFIGSLDWQPNVEALDWLLESIWPLIKDQEIQLHIAGRNMPKRYQELQSTNLHIHGEVEDGKDFIRQHGPLLVPLLAGSGVRIKILEALAEGQAVISTSTGAEGLLLRHNEHLLLADTAEDFAQAILKLSTNSELCLKLGEKGQQQVFSHYSQRAQTNQIIQFIQHLSVSNNDNPN